MVKDYIYHLFVRFSHKSMDKKGAKFVYLVCGDSQLQHGLFQYCNIVSTWFNSCISFYVIVQEYLHTNWGFKTLKEKS